MASITHGWPLAAVFSTKVGVQLLLAAVAVGGIAISPARGGAVSGPFDLMRSWSGGPWDYRYPWAGCGYPSFGFGAPYTWDQPLGFGQAGPYIWGAPFASPSLYLPEEPGEPERPTPEADIGPQPPAPLDLPPAPDGSGDTPAFR